MRGKKHGEKHYCYECGAVMEKADENVLVCPDCGHSVDEDDYVTEEEDYEEFYGSRSKYDDETYGHDNEEFPGERYEDVYGEEDE